MQSGHASVSIGILTVCDARDPVLEGLRKEVPQTASRAYFADR